MINSLTPSVPGVFFVRIFKVPEVHEIFTNFTKSAKIGILRFFGNGSFLQKIERGLISVSLQYQKTKFYQILNVFPRPQQKNNLL
jgi:hypothetical protein